LIKKIVVALDGSEVSKKALDFAIDLGEKHSAEILLLTVVEPVSSPMLFFSETDVPAVFPRAVQDYYDDLKKRHENVLSEAFKKVQEQKPKLKISTNIV
jgi:nucleotide-binding universal stress UspA family protein